MSTDNAGLWAGAWTGAVDSINEPILRRPDVLAERAFGLLELVARSGNANWPTTADPHEFARDCAMMSSVLEHGGPGFVKIAYFTTKGTQVDRVLLSLVFLTLLARLNDYAGPIAWVSFPVILLGPTLFRQVDRIFSTIRAVTEPELSQPVDYVYEPINGAVAIEPDAPPPTIFIGSQYPYRTDSLDQSPGAFNVQLGFPMICIPSRTTERLTVRMGPSPLLEPRAG